MSTSKPVATKEFSRALEIGRPPNIVKLFPNYRALIVSGKVIDRAMIGKGKAMTIAANGRNYFVIRGALRAAQRANAALIIEIAKSEGGANAYCAVNFWNMARQVDAVCNELGLTVPVAIHADHYGIKSGKDLEAAKVEIPTLFDAGITSIAIDASHLPEDQNLLANMALQPFIPVAALARIGDARAIDELGRWAVADGDRGVRESAIVALGQSKRPEASRYLQQTFASPDRFLMQASSRALLDLEEADGIAAFVELALRGQSSDVRRYAALLLVTTRGREHPAVQQLLTRNPDPEVRHVIEHGIELHDVHRHE